MMCGWSTGTFWLPSNLQQGPVSAFRDGGAYMYNHDLMYQSIEAGLVGFNPTHSLSLSLSLSPPFPLKASQAFEGFRSLAKRQPPEGAELLDESHVPGEQRVLLGVCLPRMGNRSWKTGTAVPLA